MSGRQLLHSSSIKEQSVSILMWQVLPIILSILLSNPTITSLRTWSLLLGDRFYQSNCAAPSALKYCWPFNFRWKCSFSENLCCSFRSWQSAKRRICPYCLPPGLLFENWWDCRLLTFCKWMFSGDLSSLCLRFHWGKDCYTGWRRYWVQRGCATWAPEDTQGEGCPGRCKRRDIRSIWFYWRPV